MGPRANFHLFALPSMVFALLDALAWEALQFDATLRHSVSQTNGVVVAWLSARDGVEATPAHPFGNGWASPTFTGNGVSFLSASWQAAPLSFECSQTGLVSRVFVVADAEAAAPHATLLDALSPLRLSPPAEDGLVYFPTSSVLSSMSLEIDFTRNNVFSRGLHTYEAAFFEPCPLGGIYLGGNPATPIWRRSWNGSVREVIFLSPQATAAEAVAVRSYLSKKWRTGRYASHLPDEPVILHSLGVRTGMLYGSQMLVR